MPKTDNKCWSCGQNTMISFEEVGYGWLKCSSCGATDMPNPTKSTFAAVTEPQPDRLQGTSYSPRAKRERKEAPAREA